MLLLYRLSSCPVLLCLTEVLCPRYTLTGYEERGLCPVTLPTRTNCSGTVKRNLTRSQVSPWPQNSSCSYLSRQRHMASSTRMFTVDPFESCGIPGNLEAWWTPSQLHVAAHVLPFLSSFCGVSCWRGSAAVINSPNLHVFACRKYFFCAVQIK